MKYIIQLIILLVFLKSILCSTHFFGKRQRGDKLLETKELINRKSTEPIKYIIKYNHFDNRPISMLEYRIDDVDTTALITFTENDSVNATINGEPTTDMKATLNIYGYNKLTDAPTGFESLFKIPQPIVVRRKVKYNVMHKNINDFNGIRHISYGERQPNDKMLNFTIQKASQVLSWTPFIITYNGTGFITYVEFDLPSQSADLIGFVPTEHDFRAIVFDPMQRVYDANTTIYGYAENNVPKSYTPIMRLQNIEDRQIAGAA